ncbi:MAG: hypothetical protein WDN06_07610 [Asticcacaulis sp.]
MSCIIDFKGSIRPALSRSQFSAICSGVFAERHARHHRPHDQLLFHQHVLDQAARGHAVPRIGRSEIGSAEIEVVEAETVAGEELKLGGLVERFFRPGGKVDDVRDVMIGSQGDDVAGKAGRRTQLDEGFGRVPSAAP